MVGSLHTLLQRSLDYAGLFPPAKLDLPTALGCFRSYQDHPHADFLARFVMPLDRLDESSKELEQMISGSDRPWRFAGLLRLGSLGLPEAKQAVEYAASSLRAFEKAFPEAWADTIELDLPAEAWAADDGFSSLRQFNGFLEESFSIAQDRWRIFLELDWRKEYEPLMEVVAERHSEFGVKLRTGGETADMVPPAAAVARFLVSAARWKLPMKATAGLHVPVPNHNEAVGARMHGFLNLLIAGLVAYSGRGNPADVETILSDFAYEDFLFDKQALRCGTYRFSAPEIWELRRDGIVSFGSCSFTEPLEHLGNHGLL